MLNYWWTKLRTDGPRQILIRRWFRYKKYWTINNYVFGKLVELMGNRVNIGALRFSVDNSQITTREKSIFFFGKWEQHERHAIDSYLHPGLPVVELGGCLGVVSCHINKKLERPEQHVVIEANPGILPTLEKNRELNNCKFVVRHAALGYETTNVNLHLAKIGDNSLWSVSDNIVEVPAVSLETILKDTKFEIISLVMDIEGGEVDLLEREIDVLKKSVATLIFELHRGEMCSEARWDAISTSLIGADFRMLDRISQTWVFENTRLVH
jgi:FkbM family methyltransferase